MPLMKRHRAFKLLLFLLAGAIINVAVAWGCWLWAPSQLLRNAWLGQHTQGFGWRTTKNYSDGFDTDSFEQAFFVELKDECGWPILVISGEAQIEIPTRLFSDREMLPIAPIWPGFAINTIFYAAIFCALFAVPGTVRRRVRIRRGVCVRCAYPLGTSSVCSECGMSRNAVHGAAAPCNPRSTEDRQPITDNLPL
jgi:hypothetical protein